MARSIITSNQNMVANLAKNKVEEEYQVCVYTVTEASASAMAYGELGIPSIPPRTRSTDGDPGTPGS
jgi:hypothetical protein